MSALVDGLLILVVLFGLLVAQVSAFASVLRVGYHRWRAVGRSRGGLLALIVVTGVIGAVYYWAVIRPELVSV